MNSAQGCDEELSIADVIDLGCSGGCGKELAEEVELVQFLGCVEGVRETGSGRGEVVDFGGDVEL